MTKIEMLRAIVNGENFEITEDMRQVAATMIAAYEKSKAKSNEKNTVKRQGNEALAEDLVKTVMDSFPRKCSELRERYMAIKEQPITVSKVSYLCRLAVEMGIAQRGPDEKGLKTYFDPNHKEPETEECGECECADCDCECHD